MSAADPAQRRPWWATALAVFCACTVVFLAARDLFVPEAREVEVWFGLELRGAAAIATAPLHWALFAWGAWAYWNCKPWVWPWAAVYAFAIALSHGVWNLTSPAGGGVFAASWQVALFAIPGFLLLTARFPERLFPQRDDERGK